MKNVCRAVVAISLAVGIAAARSPAFAQAWPAAKPITMVVPVPPGPTIDMLARLVAAKLSQSLGQTVIVDNRSGANGMIGSSIVAHAAPDGYTLLAATPASHVTAVHLMKNLAVDPVKDFTPITAAVEPVTALVVNAELPVNSVQELIAYAKANPGKLSYGVGNSTSQIVGEALKKRTGTDIVRVPYRSNPAVVTDLLGGQIQIMIADFNTGMIQLKAGKVSALAVLTRDRNPALPDVPTLSETVMPGYHILAWAGMFGPAGMPPEAVKVLADAVQKALDNPEVRKRFAGAGTDVYWSGPQQFAEFVKTELVSWTAMIKEAGIEPE